MGWKNVICVGKYKCIRNRSTVHYAAAEFSCTWRSRNKREGYYYSFFQEGRLAMPDLSL